MKKRKKIIIMMILILSFFFSISLANGNIQILPDQQIVQPGEKVTVTIDITDTEIAAFTLEIYWDTTKLKYISGPENSNLVEDKILYTWVAEDGKNKKEIKIDQFSWEAIEKGEGSILVIGEFYNEDGEKIEIENQSRVIKIGEEEKESNIELGENTEANNANLKILRLNQEGINPDFEKNIKEYYFITDEEIKALEVTAIPENQNASVTITGNENLKMGKNTIDIKVESQDKSQIANYKINVTKTNNIQAANANLENLAIRQSALDPEFEASMTQYQAEVGNEVTEIDILAVPQDQKATAKITGSRIMQEGDNKIEVNVLAQDGITNKKYEITIHRRSKQEEAEKQEEEKIQAERLATILEEQRQEEAKNEINNIENEELSIPEEIEKNKKNIFIFAFVTFLIILIIGVLLYKNKSKKWKNKRIK